MIQKRRYRFVVCDEKNTVYQQSYFMCIIKLYTKVEHQRARLYSSLVSLLTDLVQGWLKGPRSMIQTSTAWRSSGADKNFTTMIPQLLQE